jgi:ParB-like nuclease domain
MTKKTQKAPDAPAPSANLAAGAIQIIATNRLQFDPQNPRFYRLNDATSVQAVVEEMFDDESVQDLMLSIGSKGYFAGEPLLVAQNGDGTFVVVEGNRRLAATKLLNGELQPPSRRSAMVAQLRQEVSVAPPMELPCLLYQDRKDVLRYLGYRHITGVRPWDSLSKAKYLFQLRAAFHSKLERDVQLKSLAADIGSRPDYVAQLLTALQLYMIASEQKPAFFGLPVRAEDIEFSYITTALNYRNIVSWLGLADKGDYEMLGLKTEELKNAFGWMFSKNQIGQTVVGESRRLSMLAEIVRSPEATVKLVETSNLEEAFLYTNGPQAALEQALDQAIDRVRVVWEMIGSSQALTQEHLRRADALSEKARDVRNALRSKLED